MISYGFLLCQQFTSLQNLLKMIRRKKNLFSNFNFNFRTITFGFKL